MKSILTLLLITIVITACGQSQSPMKVNIDAKQKLNKFIQKSKFEAEPGTLFNGLSNSKLKSQLNDVINQATKDFLSTINHQPTEKKFQDDIGIGLMRFNTFYNELDTEDRERICTYFEELMDCVGLQSSNGQLNEWMYDFDPTKKN